MILGNCFDDLGPLREEDIAFAARVGATAARLQLYWPGAQPTPADPDWSKPDNDVALLRKYGFSINLNLCGVPAWASGGFPAYLEGVHGCMAWIDPNDGSKGIRFATERPYCAMPPHIDGSAVAKFTAALVSRYSGVLGDSWSAWNEPGIINSWPVRLADGWPDLDRLSAEVIAPFSAATANLVRTGPEAFAVGEFVELLKWEPKPRAWFDYPSYHPYPLDVDGTPENALARVDEYHLDAEPWRDGRLYRIGEVGFHERGQPIPQQIANLGNFLMGLQSRPLVECCMVYAMHRLYRNNEALLRTVIQQSLNPTNLSRRRSVRVGAKTVEE